MKNRSYCIICLVAVLFLSLGCAPKQSAAPAINSTTAESTTPELATTEALTEPDNEKPQSVASQSNALVEPQVNQDAAELVESSDHQALPEQPPRLEEFSEAPYDSATPGTATEAARDAKDE